MRALALSLLAITTLAACDSGSEEAENPSVPKGQVAESPAPIPTDASTELDTIPPAFQGRWGLVAADCEPGRSDAKGLLTITAEKLEFYESVGMLDEVEEAAPNRILASFDFTGEGMSWERDMAFELENGGSAMVRSEFGAEAAPDPFRYTKCN